MYEILRRPRPGFEEAFTAYVNSKNELKRYTPKLEGELVSIQKLDGSQQVLDELIGAVQVCLDRQYRAKGYQANSSGIKESGASAKARVPVETSVS